MTTAPGDPGAPAASTRRITIAEGSPAHPHALQLLRAFHAEQVGRYGYADPVDLSPSEYTPPNGAFAVAYSGSQSVGCGGYRWHDRPAGTVEIKKLYLVPEARGIGAGRALLAWLERHAAASGARRAILETGVRNTDALRLFTAAGYEPVERYVAGRDPQINRAFARALTRPPTAQQLPSPLQGRRDDKEDACPPSSEQHDCMTDLRWDQAVQWLECDGSLLDGVIEGTTVEDWQAVIDLIRSVGWWYEYLCDGRPCRMPARAVDILAAGGQSAVALGVRPVPGILVNFHFFGSEAIDFDFDPRELQGQPQLDVLCQVVRRIGRKVGKAVIVAPEGLPSKPAAAYNPATKRVEGISPTSPCRASWSGRLIH